MGGRGRGGSGRECEEDDEDRNEEEMNGGWVKGREGMREERGRGRGWKETRGRGNWEQGGKRMGRRGG